MGAFDPTIWVPLLSVVASGVISYFVSRLEKNKTDAEATRISSEAEQLQRKLERGDAADIFTSFKFSTSLSQ